MKPKKLRNKPAVNHCKHLGAYKTMFNGYYCPACERNIPEEEIHEENK